jgi:hypothetical protein
MISLKMRQAALLGALILTGSALWQATAQPRPAQPGLRIQNFIAASGELGVDMGDHPSHKGPLHNSFSHLRYSTEWVKEAFNPSQPEFQDWRMKVMVALAVEAEAMCEQVYYSNKGNGGPGGDGYPCPKGDSLESMERQLDAIKAWVKENSSWMEIAYTAADARRIVNSNKLAIILGIESEYSFGAENRKFDPVERLNRYYDKGVRTCRSNSDGRTPYQGLRAHSAGAASGAISFI